MENCRRQREAGKGGELVGGGRPIRAACSLAEEGVVARCPRLLSGGEEARRGGVETFSGINKHAEKSSLQLLYAGRSDRLCRAVRPGYQNESAVDL
jgi:hypothetical protein